MKPREMVFMCIAQRVGHILEDVCVLLDCPSDVTFDWAIAREYEQEGGDAIDVVEVLAYDHCAVARFGSRAKSTLNS